nr:DUF202 domain-containing protein [Nocardioides sp. B-3]
MSPTSPTRRLESRVYDGTEEPDVRFTPANERTFLAWIRTALGCPALAVAADALELGDEPAFRVAVCVALSLFAIAVCVHGWWSWARTERAIRRGEPLPRRRAPVPVLVGLVAIAVPVTPRSPALSDMEMGLGNGLQPERTQLSWSRTRLAIVACSLSGGPPPNDRRRLDSNRSRASHWPRIRSAFLGVRAT